MDKMKVAVLVARRAKAQISPKWIIYSYFVAFGQGRGYGSNAESISVKILGGDLRTTVETALPLRHFRSPLSNPVSASKISLASKSKPIILLI